MTKLSKVEEYLMVIVLRDDSAIAEQSPGGRLATICCRPTVGKLPILKPILYTA